MKKIHIFSEYICKSFILIEKCDLKLEKKTTLIALHWDIGNLYIKIFSVSFPVGWIVYFSIELWINALKYYVYQWYKIYSLFL